ncbi:hypothetical protein DW954_16185 [Clostridium sp. AM45-5]|nr:hypothetical protein [Clostridium sp. AM45-5]RHS62185.1 hypothetical protein DW954_16185 [Clostridium sp. AM45-5]
MEQKEIRRLDEKDYQDTGDRGGGFSVPVFAWNWFLYSLGFEQKVEQYDEHIALYVTNTFVRTRFRYPHYMYEENWLFMRSLSDEEQQEAVLKYGDPDDYYREYH